MAKVMATSTTTRIIITKRQLGSANLGSPGTLFGKAAQGSQRESCLGGWRCKGPREEVDRRRLGWTASRKTLEAFGAVPHDGKGRKLVAFGVVVKDGRDWMTAGRTWACGTGGSRGGAEILDNAWRRVDFRQPNVRHQREASEFVQKLQRAILFCFALLLLFLFVFFLRYTIGESGMGPALFWGAGGG